MLKRLYLPLLMDFRFVAESTGHQMSSRLLSMKSANALLELPTSGSVISAGTFVSAIIISDASSFGVSKSFSPVSSHAPQRTISQEVNVEASEGPEFTVAILTVSDTVASGSGPDRRYSIIFLLVASLSECGCFNVSLMFLGNIPL